MHEIHTMIIYVRKHKVYWWVYTLCMMDILVDTGATLRHFENEI